MNVVTKIVVSLDFNLNIIGFHRFGVGLVSVHRRFPTATSIVSRRSSRQYSHSSFIRVSSPQMLSENKCTLDKVCGPKTGNQKSESVK